jgi:peptidoglycan/LPS O-acetylase OafA/YrhL
VSNASIADQRVASPKRSVRRINWDVLRVLAVTSVLLQHATHTGPANHPQFGPPAFVFPLSMGASTLMVISAFFACASLDERDPVRFVRNRLARLLPAYAAAVVLTFAVQQWFAPQGWSGLRVRDVVFNLLLLQQWWPDVNFVDFAYWTVPVQVFAFIAGAFLVARPAGRGMRLRVLLWALVIVPLLMRNFAGQPGVIHTIFDGFALHRAQLFASGVAVWLWSKGRFSSPHLAALLTAALVAQGIHSGEFESTIGFGVLMLGVLAAAAGPDWWPLRRLSRPITWLAGISYGVYLVHQEIGMVVMDRLVRWGAGPWTVLAGFFASAVLLGWLITKFVERPAYRWLTRASRSEVVVRLMLAFRLHRARWISPELTYAQSGSLGGFPPSPEPSRRPVSQPNTSLAEPRTVTELSLPPMLISHVR